MRRFLYDTSIFIYALGIEHPYRAKLAWWHPVEPNDVQRGLDLFEAGSNLGARDAAFAAVALNRGIDTILTTDHAFEKIGGLERIDPADERAVATLIG